MTLYHKKLKNVPKQFSIYSAFVFFYFEVTFTLSFENKYFWNPCTWNSNAGTDYDKTFLKMADTDLTFYTQVVGVDGFKNNFL